MRRKGSICLYWDLRLCKGTVLSVCIGTCDCAKERFSLSVLGPETVRRKGSICLYWDLRLCEETFYLSVLGPETVRRKGSICLYWDLRLREGKVLSLRIGT